MKRRCWYCGKVIDGDECRYCHVDQCGEDDKDYEEDGE
jgi:RNA polymerase subunit RPABC4/transcription elongation factor Spt4